MRIGLLRAWARLAIPVAAVVLLAAATMASAGDGPHPPCDGNDAVPAFAAPGPAPAIRVWFADDLDGPWQPPGCLAWAPRADTILVATAGRFDEPGGMPAIIGRLAAVSRLTEVQYWSVTRQRWRPLITDAFALRAPDRGQRRADFAVDEFRPGAALYFWQHEQSPAGSVIYRIDVHDHTPDRLVLEMANAAPVRLLLLPLIDTGAYRSLYIIDRGTEGLWRYYSLLQVPAPSGLPVRAHRASYVNRAAAIFRHIAGLPGNAEPPLAPRP